MDCFLRTFILHNSKLFDNKEWITYQFLHEQSIFKQGSIPSRGVLEESNTFRKPFCNINSPLSSQKENPLCDGGSEIFLSGNAGCHKLRSSQPSNFSNGSVSSDHGSISWSLQPQSTKTSNTSNQKFLKGASRDLWRMGQTMRTSVSLV